MSYDAGDNALQEHLDVYEVEKCSREGPSSNAIQDAQVTPAIEDFGELAPVVQYLRYGHENQLNTSSYPIVDNNYQSDDTFAFIDPSVIMQAASPSFVDPSSWSAQPFDDPRMSHQALIGDELGDNELFGSMTGDREAGGNESVGQRQSENVLNDDGVPVGDTRRRGGARIWRRRPLEEFELEEIKLKYAQGVSTAQTFKKHSGRAVHNFRNRVRGKWGSWTSRQDQELIRLYEEKGDDWAGISKELPGVSRNADEVRVRLERLDKREREGGKQHQEPRGRYQYKQEEDDDIKLQLAQGISCGELAKQPKYRHLHGKNIKRHAKIIGASWDEDDDEKLQENVMRYQDRDMDIDWGFFGEQYNPPRDAELVATRWGHIQARYNNVKEFESEMSDGAGGHAQGKQASQIQQYSDDQPSSQAYPENTSQYPAAGSSSFQPAATTQSLAAEHESHVKHYGHHISDWSSYPDQAITSSGELNHWDIRLSPQAPGSPT